MSATTALPYQASGRTLLRASLAALVAGAAVLTLFVLPAEYGVDPTGAGSALGLTAISGGVEEAEDAAPASPPAAAPHATLVPQTKANIAQATPLRRDEKTVTIAPHEGQEIKARMKAGEALLFSWKASGPVKMDMHGEPTGGGEDFSTYWKEKGLSSAQGSFTAPFAGTHGWYFRNQSETPVTVTVATSGFYAELFEPTPE